MNKLNGWQRAWVVTALVWLAVVLLFAAGEAPENTTEAARNSAAVWAGPLIVIYLLGLGVAWVRAGFRQSRSDRERSTNAATPPPPRPLAPSPPPAPPPPTTRQPAYTASRRSTTGQQKLPFTVLALFLVVAAAVWAYSGPLLAPDYLVRVVLLFTFLFFVPPFAIGMAIARRTVAWIVIGSIATIGWIIWLSLPAEPAGGVFRGIALVIAFFVIAVVNAVMRGTRGWENAAIISTVIFVVVMSLLVDSSFRTRRDIQSLSMRSHQQQQTTQAARSADMTFSLRQRASGIVDPLVQSGISGDEARRIAIFEMPSTANIDRWKSELLPRLDPGQRRTVISLLDDYQSLRRQRQTDNLIHALMDEQYICYMLQKETSLTMDEIFEVWRVGLCNQSEAWWESQLRGLPTAQREELKRLRRELIDEEAGGTTVSGGK